MNVPDTKLAGRLLAEFSRTRTNYHTLVPRIVDLFHSFKVGGPDACPVPVVSRLDQILSDSALTREENVNPMVRDNGLVTLCTERRPLRSGGGGKYYFIDLDGQLVGCHKARLPDMRLAASPVLLKNLIFVFLLDPTAGSHSNDPRGKSSNPQRLLEYYEALVSAGQARKIRRLVRVWSMEVLSQHPYDKGYPHVTLMWITTLDLQAVVAKWRQSAPAARRAIAGGGGFDWLGFCPEPAAMLPPSLAAGPRHFDIQSSTAYIESIGFSDPASDQLALHLWQNFATVVRGMTVHQITTWCVSILSSLDAARPAAMRLVAHDVLGDPQLNDYQRLRDMLHTLPRPHQSETLKILLASLLYERPASAATPANYGAPLYHPFLKQEEQDAHQPQLLYDQSLHYEQPLLYEHEAAGYEPYLEYDPAALGYPHPSYTLPFDPAAADAGGGLYDEHVASTRRGDLE